MAKPNAINSLPKSGYGRHKPRDPMKVSTAPVNPPPLNHFKGFAYVERREGAHDYRQIPSLMGGERVPYCGIRGRSGL